MLFRSMRIQVCVKSGTTSRPKGRLPNVYPILCCLNSFMAEKKIDASRAVIWIRERIPVSMDNLDYVFLLNCRFLIETWNSELSSQVVIKQCDDGIDGIYLLLKPFHLLMRAAVLEKYNQKNRKYDAGNSPRSRIRRISLVLSILIVMVSLLAHNLYACSCDKKCRGEFPYRPTPDSIWPALAQYLSTNGEKGRS